MKNKKRIQLLVLVVLGLFLLSGCSIPMDEQGNVIQITSDTTFQQMFQSEDWFSTFFVYPIAQAINYLAPIFGDSYGVAAAIAITTISVHVLVLLATLKSTIAQQKMQLIQPEIVKIQKKYEGKKDQASQMKQGQEMQAVYQKHNINPLTTLLGSFLQLPIIFSIFYAVRRAEVVATGSFMGMSLEITPLDGILNGEMGYLVLFIIMIIFQTLSMKLPQFMAEKKAREAAESEGRRYVKQKQPMGAYMNVMLLVIPFISISWPTAMTIYWIISSFVTVVKTFATQAIIANHNSKQNPTY